VWSLIQWISADAMMSAEPPIADCYTPWTFDYGASRRNGIKTTPRPTLALAPFWFIHGAGGALKESIFSFAAALVSNNVPVFAFDHGDVGPNDGGPSDGSSLRTRVDEAKFAIELMSHDIPLTLCGTSMGGHIALRVSEVCIAHSIVLFCPAIYNRHAYDVPFGEGFRRVIRCENSWRDSDATDALRRFHGRLLIVIGERDKIIPHSVVQELVENAEHVSCLQIIRIPECPHGIHPWLRTHPDVGERIGRAIVDFCYPRRADRIGS